MNLLSNAIKFTADGGRIVSRIARTDSGGVKLSVCDTEIGIHSEDLAKAVEPFFQVDGTLSRPQEGTGFGLTLSKMFIELHGGGLDIDSDFGTGTTVTARFPASVVQDRKNAAASQVSDD